MVEGLNRLMEDLPVQGLSEVESVVLGSLVKATWESMDRGLPGAFPRIQRNANATVEQLSSLVRGRSRRRRVDHHGGEEIAVGNTDLSSGPRSRPPACRRRRPAWKQLTSTVKQNADNARQANQLAENGQPGRGEGRVGGGRGGGDDGSITAASKKIVDIISVIDGIAFQTNILALERGGGSGARRGAGSGFAVVATGGEEPGAEERERGQGDQGADRGLGGEGGGRVEAGGGCRGDDGGDREVGEEGDRHHGEITAASVEQSGGSSR